MKVRVRGGGGDLLHGDLAAREAGAELGRALERQPPAHAPAEHRRHVREHEEARQHEAAELRGVDEERRCVCSRKVEGV